MPPSRHSEDGDVDDDNNSDDVDSAVPPPIGLAAVQRSARASRRPSAERQRHREAQEQQQQLSEQRRQQQQQPQQQQQQRSQMWRQGRTPNDVRVKPASQDVMNGLLDSLASMASMAATDTDMDGEREAIIPSMARSFVGRDYDYEERGDELGGLDRAAPPPSVLRSRPSSRSSNANFVTSLDHRWSRPRTADESADFVQVAHPPQDPDSSLAYVPHEDAAEPPVVRTSRPPSGFSRTGGGGSSSGVATPSRKMSRKLSSPRIFSSAAERLRSNRSTPRQAMSPAQSKGFTPQQSTRPSIDVASSMHEQYYTPTASFVAKGKARETSESNRTARRPSVMETPTAQERVSPRIGPAAFAVPDRRASLQTSPSHPPASGTKVLMYNSAPQSLSKTSTMVATVNGERQQEASLSQPPQSNGAKAEEEDSDEDPSARRIRELEAKREERRRSRDQNRDIFASGPGSGGQGPTSLQSSSQMADAGLRVDLGDTSTPKVSYDVPRHSRQSSGSQRWALLAPTMSNRTESGLGMGGVRLQSRVDDGAAAATHRGVSIDTRRASVDSVQASVREYLGAARLTQRLQIPGEARTVAFSEVGDPRGHVVLCCVGMGLTRYVTAFYDELAASLGLRLITPDRPGIGESDAYVDGPRTPMSWPDDVQAICDHLRIRTFSLLAHSAGAIYALATALRLPHYLRGKIHLLAPWIPPSQLTPTPQVVGVGGGGVANGGAGHHSASSSTAAAGVLPRSQRFLRILPSSFFKLSNLSFAGLGSRSKSPRPAKGGRARRSTESARPGAHRVGGPAVTGDYPAVPPPPTSFSSTALVAPTASMAQPPSPHMNNYHQFPSQQQQQQQQRHQSPDAARQRQRAYDELLTPRIWELATSRANPSVDLLICLERHRPIGFAYADVGAKPAVRTAGERPGRTVDLGVEADGGNQWPGMGIVIHHGSKDARVPLENIRWLGRRMVACEVRVLDGLGHGLMGEAGVMGGVLAEVGRERDELAVARVRPR